MTKFARRSLRESDDKEPIDLTSITTDNGSNMSAPNDKDSNPIVGFLGDSADSDSASLFDHNRNLPEDPEGYLENRLNVEMGRHGIQSFQEDTYYPESRRTISKHVTFQE